MQLAGLDAEPQALLVGVGQGQHLAAGEVLGHARDQPFLVEYDLIEHHRIVSDGYSMPRRSSMSSSRRQRSRTRTRRSRWTLAPSSPSSEERAAVPISPTLAPPLPIRIRFWDSASAQTSARTVTRPSSRVTDVGDHDLDRVRDLLAGPVEDLLADQLGQQQLARLVALVLGRVEERALGGELRQPLDERVEPLARAGADREDLVDPLELGRLGEDRDQLVGPDRVDLVDRADRRQLPSFGAEQGPGDERVAGADPLFAVDDEQGDVRFGELALDPVLHALGHHVARLLDAGQVDEDELAFGLDVGRDPADRPSRRLRADRAIATWLPTIALTSVDLPALGLPARPMKAARWLISLRQHLVPAAPASRRRRPRGRSRRGGGRRGRRPR